MKILFYSDIHIRDYGSFQNFNIVNQKGYTLELENISKAFDFIESVIISHRPDLVINLGDTVNNPDSITCRSLSVLVDGFKKITEVSSELKARHIIIPGNHEILNENLNMNMLSVLKLTDYSELISTPLVKTFSSNFSIGFIPYMSNVRNFNEYYNEFITTCDLICCHGECLGAVHESGKEVESRVNPQAGIPVFSGHIHTQQVIKDWRFVGSVIRNKFYTSKNKTLGGVGLYDTDSKDYLHIENDFSRHYIRIYDLNDLQNLDPSKVALQIVSNEVTEEVKSFLKEEGYMYSVLKPIQEKSDVKKHYNSFTIGDPVKLLSTFIAEDNPDAKEDFDEVVK
jgi:hypothetical protein